MVGGWSRTGNIAQLSWGLSLAKITKGVYFLLIDILQKIYIISLQVENWTKYFFDILH